MCSYIRILLTKKPSKIRMIFDVENWLWKSNFGTFWHLPITPLRKIQWFHLTTVDFYPKSVLILYPSLENSTTGTAIMLCKVNIECLAVYYHLSIPNTPNSHEKSHFLWRKKGGKKHESTLIDLMITEVVQIGIVKLKDGAENPFLWQADRHSGSADWFRN